MKFGSELGPCDGIYYGSFLWNITVGSCTIKMDGYPLGE